MPFDPLYFVFYCAVPFIQILGCLFLVFVRVADTPELKPYRRARKGMAAAYLIIGSFGVAMLMQGDNVFPDDLFVISLMWLIISSLQAFLISYGIILLLDINAFSKRSLCFQGILISFFVLLSLSAILIEHEQFRKILFPFFLFFYICQLVYYTRLFLLKYKTYIRNAENYFSGNEASRLRWLKISYFSFFSLGLLAILPILYANQFLDLLLSIVYGVFYVFLLLKYINYPYVFYSLRPVFEFESEDDVELEEEEESEKYQTLLAQRLEKWIQEKKFCRLGITISTLARELAVGRRSLSAYINKHEKMNFNAWINRLRINEAKTYLLEQPDMSISDIAYRVGYPEISTFSRQFKICEGVSPLKWRGQ